jgi:hypothetical protein
MDNKPTDQKFKTFFEQRELEPADHVWDRLDTMLTQSEAGKVVKSYKWTKVAASVLLLICAGFWWSKNMISDDLQVKQESKESFAISASDSLESIGKEKQLDQNVAILQKENLKAKMIRPIVTPEMEATDLSKNPNPENRIIIPTLVRSDKSDAHPESIQSDYQIHSTSLSDVHIDAAKLLSEVEERALRIQVKKKYKVDANHLLAEAEYKSKQTFMQKMYKNIQDNAGNVLTAVTNRNYVK